MEHSFDIRIAEQVGINAAIILKHLYFWVSKNEADEKHYYDGRYWTYSSVKAMCELFPYLSKKQISGALDKLMSLGYIAVGNYNSTPYDRTRWFTVTDSGFRLLGADSQCRDDEGDVSKSPYDNSISQKGKSIYISKENNNIYTNIETDIKTDIYSEPKPKKGKSGKFTPPTAEEVKEYCLQNDKLYVDPESFVAFYGSKDWFVGKNKMKDWHMAVSGWNARAKERGEKQKLFQKKIYPYPEDDFMVKPETFDEPDGEWVN